MHRVLKSGGRLAILDSDWASLIWNNRNRDLLQDVITELTIPYTSSSVPRTLNSDLVAAGFDRVQVHSHPIVNAQFDQGSYSAQMMTFLPFNDSGDGLGDQWLSEMLSMEKAGEYFFSLNRYIFCATKS